MGLAHAVGRLVLLLPAGVARSRRPGPVGAGTAGIAGAGRHVAPADGPGPSGNRAVPELAGQFGARGPGNVTGYRGRCGTTTHAAVAHYAVTDHPGDADGGAVGDRPGGG